MLTREEIFAMQKENGMWGNFHTLSVPDKKHSLSSEQALRRLWVLGFGIDDSSIAKAVDFMSDCLEGKETMQDRREKTIDWDVFTELMLSTWIRKFTRNNLNANKIAEKWAYITGASFKSGQYQREDAIKAYEVIYPEKPTGKKIAEFIYSFYHVSLLPGLMDKHLEDLYFDYLLQKCGGIYYIGYNESLAELPKSFQSRQSSKYISCIELLVKYERQKHKLKFVAQWLKDNEMSDGCWDMGSAAKDGVYFPISANWKNKGNRIADCTYRISRLLSELS